MKIWRALLVLLPVLALGLLAQAGPAVSIQSIQPLGEDEVVTIVNLSSDLVDLSGWRLESSNSLGREVKETFWFPTGCSLPAGGVLRIHSGPYARSWGDSSCGHQEIDLPWTEVEIWNDKADVAWLRDASGTLIDLYTYTTPATEAPPPPQPFLRPKPRPEGYCRWPGPRTRAGTERCCPPCPTDGNCCAVRVALESIRPIYNHGVGENWRFYALAGPGEPPVFPRNLPQVIYEGRFHGGSSIQIGAGAIEEDSRPDRGWATQTVRLCCPARCQTEQAITIDVRVRENEGCYTGCVALWRFTFKVLVEPAFAPIQERRIAPSADFIISPPGEHHIGDEVTLDASSSKGEGLNYGWDFDGDGLVDATGESENYRLAHTGMNLVTLTVTDRWGQSDSLTRGIRAETAHKKPQEKIDLGLFWLTLPALAVGYFLALAFRG